MTARRRREDAGETLLELLLTITVLGITVVSVLGAVLIAVDSSSLDRRAVQAQSLLKSWGEYVVGQTTDAGAGAYVPCASTTTYTSGVWAYSPQSSGGPLQNLPTGFTATVASVKYWNGTTFTSGSGAGGACVAATDDTGVQRVELQMTVANSLYPGLTSKYVVFVRKPCVSC